jgi:small subunit ribosomal protein S7
MKNVELSPLEIWKKALENITPQVEVKSRRVGGANFQVPMEIRPERKIAISMKNMIVFSRKRAGRSMSEKLAAEVQAAFNHSKRRHPCTESLKKSNLMLFIWSVSLCRLIFE